MPNAALESTPDNNPYDYSTIAIAVSPIEIAPPPYIPSGRLCDKRLAATGQIGTRHFNPSNQPHK